MPEKGIFLCLDFCRSDYNFSYGLHDPYDFLIFGSFELLQEDWVFTRQVVSEWKIVIARCFFSFSLLFQSLFIAFNIFGKQVLSTNLIVVPKVIDSSFGKESHFIKSLRDVLFLAPINIPIFIFSLIVLSALHCFLNTVSKKGFKLDLVAI